MSAKALTNIGQLATNDPELGLGRLGLITDAALVIENGQIAWVGEASKLGPVDELHDAEGAAVVPGFVDSHAHPVFAGDRANEFAARMKGEKYNGGGIRRTVVATRAATDAQLRENLMRISGEFHASGITTFEAKSGYGLTEEDELRSLAIASEFTPETTLMAAHVVPMEFADDPAGYVSLIIDSLMPQVKGKARWVDVFCETGAFDLEQTREILTAGRDAGLGLRIHANQLSHSGAAQLAVELGCASADHCTHLTAGDIDALASSTTVATLLPGAEFSTRSPYPNARGLIDAGATVALATDCNPGSSYTTSMPFCIALAVREMHMSPEEALWSATMGGARALRRSDIGHLGIGARADLNILNAPSHIHLSYRPGVDLISTTYIEGRQL